MNWLLLNYVRDTLHEGHALTRTKIVKNCPKTGTLVVCCVEGQWKVAFGYSIGPCTYARLQLINGHTDTDTAKNMYMAVHICTVCIRRV
jgi:hypothetical protein